MRFIGPPLEIPLQENTRDKKRKKHAAKLQYGRIRKGNINET
jgi:hypothetical protein